MSDRADIRTVCKQLQTRLATPGSDLKAIYLDLSIVLGRLQGALNDDVRAHGASDRLRHAQERFDGMGKSVRAVGFDIRLGSPSALRLGMQTALDDAIATFDLLEAADS